MLRRTEMVGEDRWQKEDSKDQTGDSNTKIIVEGDR